MLGIAFSGGGGRGSYEIGVWKALDELGLSSKVQAVSGTSVGALNALLFLNTDLQMAERIWLSISKEDILAPDEQDTLLKKIAFDNPLIKLLKVLTIGGLFSQQKMESIIVNNINFETVTKNPIHGFVTCCKYVTTEVAVFDIGNHYPAEITKIVLASSALPYIYEPVRIGNELYVDGGFAGYKRKGANEGDSNLPLQALIDSGCTEIIAVHLDGNSDVSEKIEKNESLTILHLYPSKYLGGITDGLLDFSHDGIRKRIELGYKDTIEVYAKFQKIGNTGTSIVNTMNNIVSIVDESFYTKPSLRDRLRKVCETRSVVDE